MSYEQPIDLVLRALYEASAGILSSATLETFEGSGSVGPAIADGFGTPVYVGRNDTLELELDVLDIPTAGTFNVSVETAASSGAAAWRKLGSFPPVSATGPSTLTLTGADSWVRGRYTPTAGASFAMGLTGRARLVMQASAAQVASGVGSTIDLAQYRSARVTLDATAVAGTLIVSIETAGSATAPNWRTVAQFAAVTAATSADVACVNLDRYVRVRWTLSGTATFGVSGIARLVLAQPSDRARMGIGGSAFPAVTPEEDDDALFAATADVLGALYTRYSAPLRSWEDDAKRACVAVCDWNVIAARGTEPGRKLSPEETVYYERYLYFAGLDPKSLGWIHRVANRTAHPSGLTDSATPDATDGAVERIAVRSDPLRGWGRRVAIQ